MNEKEERLVSFLDQMLEVMRVPGRDQLELDYRLIASLRGYTVLVLDKIGYEFLQEAFRDKQENDGPLDDPLLAVQMFRDAVAFQIGGTDALRKVRGSTDTEV